MRRALVLCVCLLLFSTVRTTAGDVNGDKPSGAKELAGMSAVTATAGDANTNEPSGAKELSGMSIVGNDEAPKSLYIVPWKSSEIGAETSLDPMLNEGAVPVDRDVFKRQLEFYQVSRKK